MVTQGSSFSLIKKTKIMKRIYPLVLVFALMSLCFACDTTNNSNTSQITDVPALLDRNSKIQNGKEWENVQNIYAAALSNISSQQNAVEPYIKLAEVYIHEARVTGEHGHYYPGALQVLEQALAVPAISQDQKFRALSHKASVMLSQHEFVQALAIAKEAIHLNRHNAQIYGALVDAYVELGDYENAIKMADQMIRIRPDLRSYSRVSYLREIHGDINGAIKAMEMAVDAGFPSDEQTAWARLTLGELYEKAAKPKQAEMQYQTILQERENYPFAVAALANLEFEKGNLEKAEALLNEAIEIIPEVGFYEQLAAIYKVEKREDELKGIVAEIMLMLEDDVQSGHNMNLEYAQLYLDLLENYDDALSYAADEYAKRPKNIDVNRMLALIYHQQSQTDKAIAHAEKAQRTGALFPELGQINAPMSYQEK